MAVLGRLLISSAERLDLPDLLSIDSYTAGDFKYLLKGLVGDAKPYILKGFDVIDPQNAIGTQSCSIRVADSVVFYPGSLAGPFFFGLPEGDPNALPLVPELRKNAVNYVYLTFTTFNTSTDTRAFWDPDKDGGVGGEFTQDVNTESVIGCQVNVSVGSFPANTIPVAKITVGPVVITAIEDARDLMFRLGTGGVSPDPYAVYNWRSLPNASYQRNEPPTQMIAGGVNPFEGADKNIETLKEWMDAVMSKLKELGGTVHWYDDASTFSVIASFVDALATTFKSKGSWIHDATTPGLITWTEDIQIKITSDPRTYILRAGNVTLADEQVAYLALVRNAAINSLDQAVSWTNGQPYVNTVGGSIGLFANLAKGDWIKKANDDDQLFLRVEEFYDSINAGGSVTTAANAKSIRLSANYAGSTGVEKARYDKGVYQPGDVVVSARSNTNIHDVGGNFSWLAIRSDVIENIASAVTTTLTIAIADHDGARARVTSGAAHGLVDGDRITITGSTNFNGTYIVEVTSATEFWIDKSGGPFGNEAARTARYATITTAARSTAYGLQLESANHGLNTDDTVIISATTNYNGQYLVSVRNSTAYTIPVSGAAATETSGLSTEAKVLVRAEEGVFTLVQGQSGQIGDQLAANIKAFLGMTADSQTYPDYHLPLGYNTLNDEQNYNSLLNDNVTVRLSKLTAMMADKAQDKAVKYLPSNLTTITNTTNGSAQEITFQGPGATLTLLQPGSPGNAVITLPSVAPGISLLANQSAYVTIDRNASSTPAIVIANNSAIVPAENTFVIASRLTGSSVYVWDGFNVAAGPPVPVPGDLNLNVNQDRNLKLIRGGTWSWGTGTTSGNVAANSSQPSVMYIGGSTSTWWGQSFVATSTGTITSGTLYLTASSATGTFTYQIYSDSAGVPGTLLGTSNSINWSTVTNSSLPLPGYTATFSTPISVVNGTTYHIVLNAAGITGGIYDFGASGTNPYASGTVVKTTNSGGAWTTIPTDDLAFSIDGTVSGGTALTWSAAANIQMPALAESVNLIPAGSATLTNDGDVAYVEINRTTPGGTLTVSTSAIAALTLTPNTTIIARRTGTAVIVGTHSFLLQMNESKELDAGLSIQNRALLGSGVDETTSNPGYAARGSVNRIELDTEGALDAIARHDVEFDKYFGQFRLIAKTAGNKRRVRITGSDRVVFTGETLAQELSSLRVSFTGAEIDFATGQIFGGDSTLPLSTDFSTALGVNFTPATITANFYEWYSIAANPSGTNADNTINVQFNVLAGSASASTPAAAQKPAFGGVKHLGYVVVKASGAGGSGNILTFDDAAFTLPAASSQSKVAQLGVGTGSGGGTGLFKTNYYNPTSTTLPTGSVTVDGSSVLPGDLVLFSNLGSGNNKVYKAVGTVGNITSWQPQFVFNGSDSPSNGDTVIVSSGTGFADTIGIFDGTTWNFNKRVRYFNGTDYWEVSALNSVALANNQVSPADIFSIAWLGSENMIIDYSISRGTAKETGTVTLTTDGINVGIATTNVDLTGSAGITFSAFISGSNIHLQYVSNNSGSTGQIKFVMRRWADAAGGPGGIPSYSGGGGSTVTGGGSNQQIGIWTSPTNISGNSNFNIDTTNNVLKLGSGSNIVENTILQTAAIASGVQTNALLFTYNTAYTFAIVEYSVVKGAGNYRIGSMLITQDASANVYVVDTFSDVGSNPVTLASPIVTHTINGSNVEIRYNSSGGVAGTFKYAMRRWS